MNKKILVFILLFVLASCGFQAIYHDDAKDKDSYIPELAAIRIQKHRTRLDQELKNNLYDLLNPDYAKAEPKYLLVLTTVKSVYPTFITATGASGRNKVTITVNYELKSLENGEVLGAGSTFVNDNYDVSENRYGTYIADEYIQMNLTKVAAQNIRNSLVNDFIEMKKREEEKEKNTEKTTIIPSAEK